MIVRTAVEKDIAYLADIERSASRKFTEYLGGEPDTRTTCGEVLAESFRSDRLWVSEGGTGLTGFLAARPVDDGLHVEELSVAYEFQGRGIGTALLRTVIDCAKQNRLAAVTLTTDRLLPWNASFYKKSEFAEISSAECQPGLRKILERDVASSRRPDHKIAMILALK